MKTNTNTKDYVSTAQQFFTAYDGVHLSYDRMTSFLSPYENPDALKVARELDSKVERLLNNAAVE